MNTFNGSQRLKDELLAKLKHHQELDTFIQGKWLTDEKVSGNGFKGCFYGCTMQTQENPIKKFSDKYHIDLWYCSLTERIFEGLPNGEYQKFPMQSIEVLPVDFNITKIKSKWFKATLLKQLDWITDEKIIEILKNTSRLFDVDFDKISASAAWSARSAAWSARSAAWSARSAAESAAESAESAAKENHYLFLRDLLFAIIKETASQS